MPTDTATVLGFGLLYEAISGRGFFHVRLPGILALAVLPFLPPWCSLTGIDVHTEPGLLGDTEPVSCEGGLL